MLRKLVVGLLLVVVVVSGVSGIPVAAMPGADGWGITGLRDIGAEMLAAVFQTYSGYATENAAWSLLLLSPDGSTIVSFGSFTPAGASEDDALVCRYTLADRALMCAIFAPEVPRLKPALLRSAWSPDGTRIILHEDPFMQMFESDLWLLDVATLAVTGLTDDGFEGNWMQARNEEGVYQDYNPMWSPDGDLYFLRAVYGDTGMTSALYRIAGGQGTPEHVLDLPGDINSFGVTWGSYAAMSPDGTRIALLPQTAKLPISLGIWMIDLVNGSISEFLPAAALQVGFPAWSDRAERFTDGIGLVPQQIAWTNAGATLLLYAVSTTSSEPVAGTDNYLTVDVATRTVTPLVDYDQFANEEDFLQHRATLPDLGVLTPDGETLLYLPHSSNSSDDLALYSIALPFAGKRPLGLSLTDEQYRTLLFPNRRQAYGFGYLGQTSSGGVALLGDMLISFE